MLKLEEFGTDLRRGRQVRMARSIGRSMKRKLTNPHPTAAAAMMRIASA